MPGTHHSMISKVNPRGYLARAPGIKRATGTCYLVQHTVPECTGVVSRYRGRIYRSI